MIDNSPAAEQAARDGFSANNHTRSTGESLGESNLQEYPELQLVLSLAVSAVARAFDLDEEKDGEELGRLEAAASEAMIPAYAPVAATARRMAAAAAQARRANASAVAQTAETMASQSAEVAAVLQLRSEGTAHLVAQDAADAAASIAASVAPGAEVAAAAEAARVVSAVQDAAATTAVQRARAARLVAESVTVAVSETAAAADTAAIAAELEVLTSALSVEAVAFDTCYQVAIDAATSVAQLSGAQLADSSATPQPDEPVVTPVKVNEQA